MDPNSQHQRWSKWVFLVHPGRAASPGFEVIKTVAATFARARFGMTTVMKVDEEYNFQTNRPEWRISVRSEGHPVHDPQFVAWMKAQWTVWAERGFGPGTVLELVEAKLEAGTRQDGTPADQLVILDMSLGGAK